YTTFQRIATEQHDPAPNSQSRFRLSSVALAHRIALVSTLHPEHSQSPN
ncbi:hypothetical protein L916_09230, partial [Phytophthora nicotianae]